ncbi:MAG TPA: hypothetical protein VN873_16470 [Candidatus Angelobacter sp.]|nr:hypothetical protein [Candidatus Angelobacter sp.]
MSGFADDANTAVAPAGRIDLFSGKDFTGPAVRPHALVRWLGSPSYLVSYSKTRRLWAGGLEGINNFRYGSARILARCS